MLSFPSIVWFSVKRQSQQNDMSSLGSIAGSLCKDSVLHPAYGFLQSGPQGFRGTVHSFDSRFAPSSHITNNWSSRSAAAQGQ